MVRAPCCEKMGLKRGPWTQEEDQILISYIQQHGHSNWRAIPNKAGNCKNLMGILGISLNMFSSQKCQSNSLMFHENPR